MAHRKTEQEAKEVKAKFEANHPGLEIRITPHMRGGFLISEVRICEECGKEILTSAVGEEEMCGSDYCQSCKIKVYERNRQVSDGKSAMRNAENQAYYDAEAAYYPEEG